MQHEKRNSALDGIRGIAIILVILFHLVGFCDAIGAPHGHGLLERMLRTLFGEGWAGVDLFFVLSGFLITTILLKTKDDANYFKNFYARRMLRIFPLYYLYVVVIFLVAARVWPDHPSLQGLPARQIWFWTYMENFEIFLKGRWLTQGYIWSLAIEEQFYWVWPLLVFFLPKRRLFGVAAGIFFGQLVVRASLIHAGYNPDVVPVLTVARLDGLMVGAMIAIAVQLGTSATVMRRTGWSLVFAGLALRLIAVKTHIPYAYARYNLDIMAWVIFFGGLVVFSSALPPSSKFNRVLSIWPLVFFGQYSYGIYLIHHPLLLAVAEFIGPGQRSAMANWGFIGMVGMCVVLPVCWLVYHFYELPFLNLKNRFSSRAKEPFPSLANS